MSFFTVFKDQMADIAALPDMPDANALAAMDPDTRRSFQTNPAILRKQKVKGNRAEELSVVHSDDLEELKAKLAARGLKAGKFVDADASGMLFEIEGMNGQKVDSARLRIEGRSGVAPRPGGIPAFEESSGYCHATIVPAEMKHSKVMADMERAGIHLGSTPTQAEGVRLDPVAEEKKRGKA